jgi:hypothetical protein
MQCWYGTEQRQTGRRQEKIKLADRITPHRPPPPRPLSLLLCCLVLLARKISTHISLSRKEIEMKLSEMIKIMERYIENLGDIPVYLTFEGQIGEMDASDITYVDADIEPKRIEIGYEDDG